MVEIKRVVMIVLDSVGIGELPDAHRYGDAGSNTLGNLAARVGGLHLPHLAALGLGNIAPIQGVTPAEQPLGAYGKMAERSAGKDTTTGHWEMSGIVLSQPFPTYPSGFPAELIASFTKATGRGVLGNKVASGTEIIKELGDEHLRTGNPIVYTSADSVFQIAAHESVIPLDELYRICQSARELLQGQHAVARVIARPFTGSSGAFVRTPNRRDFSLPPPQPTILDVLTAAGHTVSAVGKIADIFAGRGVTRAVHSKNNMETVSLTLQYMREHHEKGLIFANCVDFDMLWGHRNDTAGYARGLAEFDARLPEVMAGLAQNDLLVILADHGCDPTTPSTDHSREYVPLLVYGSGVRPGVALGIRDTFTDVAATLAEVFGVRNPGPGTSFWSAIRS